MILTVEDLKLVLLNRYRSILPDYNIEWVQTSYEWEGKTEYVEDDWWLLVMPNNHHMPLASISKDGDGTIKARQEYIKGKSTDKYYGL